MDPIRQIKVIAKISAYTVVKSAHKDVQIQNICDHKMKILYVYCKWQFI